MLSLRAHSIICASLFAAMVLLAPAAGALQASGLIKNPAAYRMPAMVIAGGLVAAFAFSAVPVMVKLVLGFQRTVGNENVPVVRSVLSMENVIIWAIWGLMAAGLVIAVPAAIADGAFSEEPQRAVQHLAIGDSQGTLVARPGMTVADMVRQSSLKLEAPAKAPVISGGEVFDFRIPGSNVVFPGCRYFFISTFTRDPDRIQGMSIGTSHEKLTPAEHEAADADLRRRLAGDGWLTGHEVYKDEEDRQLHGGAARGEEGRVWLKDGVVLTIESKEVDEVPAGQDPATTPTWIQAISLWSADDFSGFDRYEFAVAGPATLR